MLLKIINEETTKQLYIGDDSINDYIFDYETLKEYNIKMGFTKGFNNTK